MLARKDGMKILKSIKNSKIIFLLLVVFFIATVTEGLCNFSNDLNKVTVIENCTTYINSYAENNLRIKCNLLELVVKYQWFCNSSPISSSPYVCMESWCPRDVHLPTKSDRAPPEVISS